MRITPTKKHIVDIITTRVCMNFEIEITKIVIFIF